MSKIRIVNFGPIKEGLTNQADGWLDIKKITLFIGKQASGKSTVAKLISCMKWIEKALVRGDFSERDLLFGNAFKNHCGFQNIENYFTPQTIIEYQGQAYFISYAYGRVSVNKSDGNGYLFPKIMYVPAERNFVSSVKNVRSLRGLPRTLYAFSDEFIDANEEMSGQVELPVNKLKFEYQKLNKLSWLIGEDYKIKLSESSSGLQSSVPLSIVTRHIADSIRKEGKSNVKAISIEEEKRIKKEIQDILMNPALSEDVKKASLELLSSKFSYSGFINIVEEPEQNLFPASQKAVLFELIKYAYLESGNQLIITTHSPYLINYLALAVKAGIVADRIRNSGKQDELLNRVESIVQAASHVAPDDYAIFEFDADGNIVELEYYKGLPSDENYLNDNLAESNELFSNLLELEDLCQ